MILNLWPGDFDSEYSDPRDCAVARSFKRSFPKSDPSVDSFGIDVFRTGAVYTYGETHLNGEVIVQGNFGSREFNTIKNSIKENTFQSATVEIIKR